MTELEKYEGIYAAPDQFPTYGHSNHGAAATPFIVRWAPESLLDVGCGYNEFVKNLRDKAIPGLDAAGVDFACPGADRNVTATQMPFQDKEWDVLTAFDMLEHVAPEDVDQVLSEMCRVSKRFMFSISHVPSRNQWQGQTLHPTVQPESWWLRRIMHAGGCAIKKHGHYLTGHWQKPLRLDRSARVILVGNGPSLLSGERGAEIDGFEAVIRFNRFRIRGFEKHAGSRTDYHCTYSNHVPADEERPDRIISLHGESAKLPYEAREVYRIPRARYDGTRRDVQGRAFWKSGLRADPTILLPSAGLVTASWLLQIVEVEKLTLAGFDHFGGADGRHHYWSDWTAKDTTFPKEHCGMVEAEMFAELAAAGRVQYL